MFVYLTPINGNYCWNIGHNIPSLLEAILKVFPLDTYVSCPVCHSYDVQHLYITHFLFYHIDIFSILSELCEVVN